MVEHSRSQQKVSMVGVQAKTRAQVRFSNGPLMGCWLGEGSPRSKQSITHVQSMTKLCCYWANRGCRKPSTVVRFPISNTLGSSPKDVDIWKIYGLENRAYISKPVTLSIWCEMHRRQKQVRAAPPPWFHTCDIAAAWAVSGQDAPQTQSGRGQP